MNYTLSHLASMDDSMDNAMESYKTMKVTWENMNRMCREYTDKIEVETSIKKIIELETEYLGKINEFYAMIEDDRLSLMDKFVKKYIPTVLLVISATLACLGVSKLEAENDDTARRVMSGVGLVGAGSAILLKIKNSNAMNFKQNSLDAINEIKDKLKQDIAINQKYLSVGIKTKLDASQCTVNVDKDGKISIYRKYD